MVHRQTEYDIAFRGYSAGGARTCVDTINDSTLMQEADKSTGMKGESWPNCEAPQNYGFTSVVADASKGKDGQIDQCAEGFMSFMGGNRNFPVMASMDDRRHRLKNLGQDAAKGSSALFGLKEWGQQILNTEDGQYITGNMEKKNRMQLVTNNNGKKQQANSQSAKSATTGRYLPIKFVSSYSGVEFEIEVLPPEVNLLADGASGPTGGSGGDQTQGSGPTGQKTLHKEKSTVWVEQNGTSTQSVHGDAYSTQQTGSDSSTHWTDDKKRSTQCTEDHVHIRFKDNRIFNDEDGNWCTSPLMVKKDMYCKEK
jgi:phage gp45-like